MNLMNFILAFAACCCLFPVDVISSDDYNIFRSQSDGDGDSSNICENKSSWRFRLSNGKLRRCGWVAKRPLRRCHLLGTDGTRASQSCQVACDSCICTNSFFWRHTTDSDQIVGCGYVANAPSKRCSLTDVVGTTASEACSDACGQCKCKNSKYWRFKRKKDGRLFGCNWIAKRPERRCNIIGRDRTRARDSCLQACNRCSSFTCNTPPDEIPSKDFIANPPESPLGLCEGDCDTDADCQDDLICHKRDNTDPVPGCSGGTSDESYTDYCIEPYWDECLPELTYISNPITNGGLCEGDCDTDSECAGDLVCWNRDSGDYSYVPGCSPGEDDLWSGSTDFCVDAMYL